MPIDIEKLHAASRPIEEKILEILKANPKQAFTVAELLVDGEKLNLDDKLSRLYVMFMVMEGKGILADYGDALSRLVRGGKVESAKVNGVEYFGLKKAA